MKLPYTRIDKVVYVARPTYSWTYLNEHGGSFSMGHFTTLKRCLESCLKSHPDAEIYLNQVDWDYEADKPIETIIETLTGVKV